ncbi:hypothetical protein V500_01664 [Pseudogymnoascus sp. VKM F-4518 (FW-2643)]|nr:hypothetical protein V500_01664 [Pseudogymnoascus sp. VKM F-4518 (FW-2643)]
MGSNKKSNKESAEAALGKEILAVFPVNPKPWYQTKHLIQLNLVLLVPLFSSGTIGFDGAMMNGLQTLPQWRDYFGNPSASILGAINAIHPMGKLLGLFPSAWISDRYDRKRPMLVGLFILFIGTVLQGAAQNIRMMIVSRFILGFGTAFLAQPSPILVTELAYPTQRGWIRPGASAFQASSKELSHSFGFLASSGFQSLQANGKTEEARQILRSFHAAGGASARLVDFEINEMEENIRIEQAITSQSSYFDLYSTPGNRRRTTIASILGLFAQWSGNAVISYYLTLVLNTIGITDVSSQALINGLLQIFNWFAAVVAGALMVDRIGRRKLFLISTGGMLCSYIVWTILISVLAADAAMSRSISSSVEPPEILDIAIIGAGPCALAVAARMRETTPSALFTDAEHQRYHWIKRHKHRVKIVPTKGRATNKILLEDKSEKPCGQTCKVPKYLMAAYDSSGSDWMAKWTCLFRAYDIKTLRSPLFFHVDPRDRDGLKAYAYAEGREKEMVKLKGVVGKEISKHHMKKKMKRTPFVNAHTGKSIDERDMQDYYTPSTSLFNDYCKNCVDRYSLNNLVTQTDVHSIEYHEQGIYERPDKCFTIKTSTGTKLARTVVLAIGPGMPAPLPFTSNEAEGACHTSQLLKQECLAPHVKIKVDSKHTTNVIVVGGGLTSAQIVDLCIKEGVSKVWHIMRDNFKIKYFDFTLDWVAKYKNINQAAFWSADTDEERYEMILSARNGGSITPAYKAVLESHQTKGSVLRYTKTQIVGTSWDSTSKLWTIKTEPPIPDLPPIDYIYYATGAKADIKAMPLLKSLLQSHPIETVGGLPCLTYDMQWSKDVPLFVAGRFAGLQLGPVAANLEGARAGAERISWRLQEILEDIDRDGDCHELVDEMDELRERAERSWTHLNMFDTLSVGGD